MSDPTPLKVVLVDVSTHGYGDSQGRYINALEVAAILPNAFDDRKATIVLRSGKEVVSGHSVDEIIKLLKGAEPRNGGLP